MNFSAANFYFCAAAVWIFSDKNFQVMASNANLIIFNSAELPAGEEAKRRRKCYSIKFYCWQSDEIKIDVLREVKESSGESENEIVHIELSITSWHESENLDDVTRWRDMLCSLTMR